MRVPASRYRLALAFLAFSALAVASYGCSHCKPIVRYHRSKIEIKAAEAQLPSDLNLKVGEFSLTPQNLEASEEVKRFDQVQAAICREIRSLPPGQAKEAAQLRWLEVLYDLARASHKLAAPGDQESPPPPPSPGTLQLFEGNGCTQDLHCQFNPGSPLRINFKHGACANDDVRSMRLINVQAGSVIRVFDNPDGKRNDDWTEIKVLRRVADLCLASFQQNITNQPDLVVVYHSDNGLDGKVSRLEID